MWKLDKVKKKRKSAIVFDLDGTLTDFRRIDNQIISEIYSQKIKWLDDFLWSINSKDVLKNTMFILVIRLLLYSIFDSKPFIECYKKYRLSYFSYTYRDFRRYCLYLSEINRKNKVIILSNNKFSQGIEFGEIQVSTCTSKYKTLRLLQHKYKVRYFVGNNLFDDILVCKGSSTKTVYVGENRFIKKIADYNMHIENFMMKILY